VRRNHMGLWKALMGRVTLFPTVAPASALELYRRVWAIEPDSYQKPPSPLMQGTAQGKREGMMATCTTNPARVDFTFTPMREEEAPDLNVVLIEDLPQLQTEMLRTIESVGTGIFADSVLRVAVSMQVVKQQSGFADANRTLVELLPEQFRMRLTDEQDFIFQVNQPSVSRKTPAVTMNFITKWSVDRIQVLAFAIPLSPSPISVQQAVAAPQQQFFAASVLFDNNNVPGGVLLASSEQSSLLLEGFEAIDNSIKVMHINS